MTQDIVARLREEADWLSGADFDGLRMSVGGAVNVMHEAAALLDSLSSPPAGEVVDEYTLQKLASRQLDFLDAKADCWMDEINVAAVIDVLCDVFRNHAPPEILQRFRAQLEAHSHQSFVEGAYRAWDEIAAQGGLVRIVKADNDASHQMREALEFAQFVLSDGAYEGPIIEEALEKIRQALEDRNQP